MENNTITLNNSFNAPSHGSQLVGPTDPNSFISVKIYATVSEEGHQAYEAALKGSAHHLTYDELVNLRGASPEHLDRIGSYITDCGLNVMEVNPAKRFVVVEGTAQAIGNAFGVELHDFEHEEGNYTTHSDHFQIPPALDGIVSSIIGTNTRTIAKRSTHDAVHFEAQATDSLPIQEGAFSAMEVAEAYNFPKGLDGSGETIGIIELSGGYRESDMNAYFQAAGITKPNMISVGPNTTGSSADGEVALDIEVAGSICPGANFVIYFAENGANQQGFLDVLEKAVHDTTNNPSVISISWGSAEVSQDQPFVNQYMEVCKDAAALGITILISSGDHGSPNSLPNGYLAPSFPASLPNVLACGGTQLAASGSTIASEVVWGELAEGKGASGGGVSMFFDVPDYQSNSNVPVIPQKGIKPGFAGRGVPDISGNAAPNTGYVTYVNGKFGVVGGTSAVAPLLAGLIILINQSTGRRSGYLNEKLYQMAGTDAFRDITEGTNGIFGSDYTAKSGWDACTGLGSPNGTTILNALKEVT